MMKKKSYATVIEYINDQPEATRRALRDIRECILESVPDAIELFNYGIPAFALVKNGKREEQVMIAGYSKHVGFYPHPTTITAFRKELKQFKQGKGSIQFPNDEPIPRELIVQMVKRRKEMLDAGE